MPLLVAARTILEAVNNRSRFVGALSKVRRQASYISRVLRNVVVASAVLVMLSHQLESQAAPGASHAGEPSSCGAAADSSASPDSLLRPAAPLVPSPPAVRGLYVNRWAALGQKMWQLIGVARTTEINALVIDVKDDRGYVLYKSRVALARAIGADTFMPMRAERMRAVLDTMRSHNIYPIARIVVVKDPLLAEEKVGWSIKRVDAPDKPWLDKNGNPWLDPHQDDVWRYAADLACEAVNLGFSEVQLDYVRFPDEKRLWREATFPLSAGRPRAQVIRDQIMKTREWIRPLGVPFTVDVFGLTVSDTTDMGIGQKWESFVDAADAVLPMMYPSHYAPGSYRIAHPNANPYDIIDRGVKDAKRRSQGIPKAGKIVPWYQDFTLGKPRYGAAEIRAQIKAGYDNDIMSWILWNPRSVYTLSALRSDPAGEPADTSATRRAPSAEQRREPIQPPLVPR
ncbi:MAG: GTP-binding protein [Anaerolineae bacterium]|nr:GTP-binding protein [Gemmatimonadaceae bacterium]